VVTYGVVLDSLADSTRRELLDLVRRKPSSVRELADQLPISRPAVSQHLKILKDAGVVTSHPVGTRRVYTVTTDGFEVLRQWLDVMWRDALSSFAAFADSQPNNSGDHSRPRSPMSVARSPLPKRRNGLSISSPTGWPNGGPPTRHRRWWR
jgi:DNA-binding transcriptional ArsR family regulator